jgi:hypothetical protein
MSDEIQTPFFALTQETFLVTEKGAPQRFLRARTIHDGSLYLTSYTLNGKMGEITEQCDPIPFLNGYYLQKTRVSVASKENLARVPAESELGQAIQEFSDKFGVKDKDGPVSESAVVLAGGDRPLGSWEC